MITRSIDSGNCGIKPNRAAARLQVLNVVAGRWVENRVPWVGKAAYRIKRQNVELRAASYVLIVSQTSFRRVIRAQVGIKKFPRPAG